MSSPRAYTPVYPFRLREVDGPGLLKRLGPWDDAWFALQFAKDALNLLENDFRHRIHTKWQWASTTIGKVDSAIRNITVRTAGTADGRVESSDQAAKLVRDVLIQIAGARSDASAETDQYITEREVVWRWRDWEADPNALTPSTLWTDALQALIVAGNFDYARSFVKERTGTVANEAAERALLRTFVAVWESTRRSEDWICPRQPLDCQNQAAGHDWCVNCKLNHVLKLLRLSR